VIGLHRSHLILLLKLPYIVRRVNCVQTDSVLCVQPINPLMGTGNYSATSNNMKLVHWPLMVGCYIWYSEEGTGRGRSPPRPLLAVPNLTAHPSTASVPITVLLYNGPLLCSFNVHIKGLIYTHRVHLYSP